MNAIEVNRRLVSILVCAAWCLRSCLVCAAGGRRHFPGPPPPAATAVSSPMPEASPPAPPPPPYSLPWQLRPVIVGNGRSFRHGGCVLTTASGAGQHGRHDAAREVQAHAEPGAPGATGLRQQYPWRLARAAERSSFVNPIVGVTYARPVGALRGLASSASPSPSGWGEGTRRTRAPPTANKVRPPRARQWTTPCSRSTTSPPSAASTPHTSPRGSRRRSKRRCSSC